MKSVLANAVNALAAIVCASSGASRLTVRSGATDTARGRRVGRSARRSHSRLQRRIRGSCREPWGNPGFDSRVEHHSEPAPALRGQARRMRTYVRGKHEPAGGTVRSGLPERELRCGDSARAPAEGRSRRSRPLGLLPLIAEHDPQRFDEAAVRWHARWVSERPGLDLARSFLALTALGVLRGERCRDGLQLLRGLV